MRVLYNVSLEILHYIGAFLFAVLCFARFVFALNWSREEERMFVICGLLVFGLHYLLLWIGNKKHLLNKRTIRRLQIWELILLLPQFAFILFMFIVLFNINNLPFLLLHSGIYTAIILLRKLSTKWIFGNKESIL